ncbi:MAG: P-loop NTPase [Nitrososphaeria archaeon]
MRTVMVAVTGGKGGTGKSTIAVNLAAALAEDEDLLLADLDVEGPSDHILLGTPLKDEEPINIMLPIVRYQACTRCGICAQVCDTGAIITSSDGLPVIIPRLCSGCRSCYLACPANAIEEGMRTIGYTYRTEVALDGDGRSLRLVTGMLREGEEHTPPAVIATRRRAFSERADIYLVDTAAGTSNTVATAMEGAKLAIVVTEPTPLGASDLEMMLEVADRMGVEPWIVINRHGIGSDDLIEEVARRRGSRIVSRIPYSREVVDSYVRGRPIVLARPDSEPSAALRELAALIRGSA